jgi:integral membrane protein
MNRYRVLAYVVGVALVLLVVGMILKYTPIDKPTMAKVVAQIHGVLYMVYLVAAFDLWRRTGWPAKRMVAMVLAGVVPFMTFVVERKMVRAAKVLVDARASAGSVESA